MEYPGVSPPENEVYDNVVPPLFPSDYDSDDDYDGMYEDTDASTQHRQRVIHPESMPPTVRNVYNLLPQKQTEYVKENIDWSMSFAQVGNDLDKDA